MSAIPLSSEYVLVPIAEEEAEAEEAEVHLSSVKTGESVPWTPAETRKCICGSIGAILALVSLVVIAYVWYVVVTKYG